MTDTVKQITLTENEYKLRKNRIHYNISYNDKEEFKKLGGRRDPDNKLWYINGDNPQKNKISKPIIKVNYKKISMDNYDPICRVSRS